MATATPDLSRGPVLLSFSIGTASFAFSTTIVRFCVRTRISNSTGPDDYAIAVATTVAMIGTIFSVLESSMPDPARALEFDVLGQPWFMMGSTLAKISICLFFIRLLGSSRHWRIFLGAMIFFMAVVNLTFSLTVNLQCRPLEKFWNPDTEGECWDPSVQLDFGYFQGGAFEMAVLYLVQSQPHVSGSLSAVPDPLLLPRRDLFNTLWFLLTLGNSVGVLATARTYETSQTGGLSVYTYDTFVASLLGILEQNAGIVAANMLPMGPLFSRRARRAAGIRAKTPSTGTGNSSRSLTGNFSRVSSRAASSRHSRRSDHSRSTSSHSRASRHSKAVSSRSSDLDSKRNSTLVIEGPRRVSFDTSAINVLAGGAAGVAAMTAGSGAVTMNNTRERLIEDYELEGRSVRYSTDSFGTDVDPADWPNGIIKTVSVEVVEEENPDIPEGVAVSRLSEVTIEQDWETMLRTGPDN
ncbi:hypothetical protein VTK73DRAFT_8510 [Phialemonium thermophilum]|uniref:Rhodopsin domain-containing protein n=1 Tax=Phialemonium thermophilum TaxID=223376 RepID=A0ABR3XPG3_9PEZI